jgi:hypothetical protein
MSLIHITPAEAASNEMQEIISQLTSYTDAQLRRLHALANTPGHEQAIMDRFGPNAVQALTAFMAFSGALATVKPDLAVPEADMEVFQPQGDGRVLYGAPVVPVAPGEEEQGEVM